MIDDITSIETIAVIGGTEIVRLEIAAYETDDAMWQHLVRPASVRYTTRVAGGEADDFGDWTEDTTAEYLIAWAITNCHLKAEPGLLVTQAMDRVAPMFPRIRKGVSGYVQA